MKQTEKEIKLKINTLSLNMSTPGLSTKEHKAMHQEWLNLRNLLKWITGGQK